MSRIGVLPISIPTGVEVKFTSGVVTVNGPKGQLSMEVPAHVDIKNENGVVTVTRENEEKTSKAAHGLVRAKVANMVEGVTKGFSKQLEIIGVGYKAEVKGSSVVLALGFSHPVEFRIPSGITVTIEKEKNHLTTISGIDKETVGQVAANIRALKKPEPYKGKGIKYIDEHIVRKEGKRVGSE